MEFTTEKKKEYLQKIFENKNCEKHNAQFKNLNLHSGIKQLQRDQPM